MGVNREKPDNWKADTAKSVDFYNDWFMNFAPTAFRETRIATAKTVEEALRLTSNLRDITPEVLQDNPSVLPMLRMAACRKFMSCDIHWTRAAFIAQVWCCRNSCRGSPNPKPTKRSPVISRHCHFLSRTGTIIFTQPNFAIDVAVRVCKQAR